MDGVGSAADLQGAGYIQSDDIEPVSGVSGDRVTLASEPKDGFSSDGQKMDLTSLVKRVKELSPGYIINDPSLDILEELGVKLDNKVNAYLELLSGRGVYVDTIIDSGDFDENQDYRNAVIATKHAFIDAINKLSLSMIEQETEIYTDITAIGLEMVSILDDVIESVPLIVEEEGSAALQYTIDVDSKYWGADTEQIAAALEAAWDNVAIFDRKYQASSESVSIGNFDQGFNLPEELPANTASAYRGTTGETISVTEFIDTNNNASQKEYDAMLFWAVSQGLIEVKSSDNVRDIFGLLSTDKKAEIILQYINAQYQYQKDDSKSGFSNLVDTLNNGRRGDCEDLSIATVTLLSIAGIDAAVYIDPGTLKQQGHAVVGINIIDDQGHQKIVVYDPSNDQDVIIGNLNTLLQEEQLHGYSFEFSFNSKGIFDIQGNSVVGANFGVFEDPSVMESQYTANDIFVNIGHTITATELSSSKKFTVSDLFGEPSILEYQGEDFFWKIMYHIADAINRAFFDTQLQVLTILNQGISPKKICEILNSLKVQVSNGSINQGTALQLMNLFTRGYDAGKVVDALKNPKDFEILLEGTWDGHQKTWKDVSNHLDKKYTRTQVYRRNDGDGGYNYSYYSQRIWSVDEESGSGDSGLNIKVKTSFDGLEPTYKTISLASACKDLKNDKGEPVSVEGLQTTNQFIATNVQALGLSGILMATAEGSQKKFTPKTPYYDVKGFNVSIPSGVAFWANSIEYDGWRSDLTGFDASKGYDVNKFWGSDGQEYSGDRYLITAGFGGVYFKEVDFEKMGAMIEELENRITYMAAMSIVGEEISHINNIVLEILLEIDLADIKVFSSKRLINRISKSLDAINSVLTNLIDRADKMNDKILEIKIREAKKLARNLASQRYPGSKNEGVRSAAANLYTSRFQDVLVKQMRQIVTVSIKKLAKVLGNRVDKLADSSDPFNVAKSKVYKQLLTADYDILDTEGGAGKFNFNKEAAIKYFNQINAINNTRTAWMIVRDSTRKAKELVIKKIFNADVSSDTGTALIALIDALDTVEHSQFSKIINLKGVEMNLRNAVKDTEKAIKDAAEQLRAAKKARSKGGWGSVLGFIGMAFSIVSFFAVGPLAIAFKVVGSVLSAASAYLQYSAQMDLIEAQEDALKDGLQKGYKVADLKRAFIHDLMLDSYDTDDEDDISDFFDRKIYSTYQRLISQLWGHVLMLGGETGIIDDVIKGAGFQSVDAKALMDIRTKIMGLKNSLLALSIVMEAVTDLNDIVYQILYGVKTKVSIIRALRAALNDIFATIDDAAQYQINQKYARVAENNRIAQIKLDLEELARQKAAAKKALFSGLFSAALSMVAALAPANIVVKGAILAVQVGLELYSMYVFAQEYKYAQNLYNRFMAYDKQSNRNLLDEMEDKDRLRREEYLAKAKEQNKIDARIANIVSYNRIMDIQNRIIGLINNLNFKNATIHIGNDYRGINPSAMLKATMAIAQFFNQILAILAMSKSIEDARETVLAILYGISIDSGSKYLLSNIQSLNNYIISGLQGRMEQINLDLDIYNKTVTAKHKMEEAKESMNHAFKMGIAKIIISIVSYKSESIMNEIKAAKRIGQSTNDLQNQADALNKLVAVMKFAVAVYEALWKEKFLKKLMNKETLGDLEKVQKDLMNLFENLFVDVQDPFVKAMLNQVKSGFKGMTFDLAQSVGGGQITLNTAHFVAIQDMIDNIFRVFNAMIEIQQAKSDAMSIVREITTGFPGIAENIQISKIAFQLLKQSLQISVSLSQQHLKDYVKRYNARVKQQIAYEVQVKSSMMQMLQALAFFAHSLATLGSEGSKGLLGIKKLDAVGEQKILAIIFQIITYHAKEAAREKAEAKAEKKSEAKHKGKGPILGSMRRNTLANAQSLSYSLKAAKAAIDDLKESIAFDNKLAKDTREWKFYQSLQRSFANLSLQGVDEKESNKTLLNDVKVSDPTARSNKELASSIESAVEQEEAKTKKVKSTTTGSTEKIPVTASSSTTKPSIAGKTSVAPIVSQDITSSVKTEATAATGQSKNASIAKADAVEPSVTYQAASTKSVENIAPDQLVFTDKVVWSNAAIRALGELKSGLFNATNLLDHKQSVALPNSDNVSFSFTNSAALGQGNISDITKYIDLSIIDSALDRAVTMMGQVDLEKLTNAILKLLDDKTNGKVLLQDGQNKINEQKNFPLLQKKYQDLVASLAMDGKDDPNKEQSALVAAIAGALNIKLSSTSTFKDLALAMSDNDNITNAVKNELKTISQVKFSTNNIAPIAQKLAIAAHNISQGSLAVEDIDEFDKEHVATTVPEALDAKHDDCEEIAFLSAKIAQSLANSSGLENKVQLEVVAGSKANTLHMQARATIANQETVMSNIDPVLDKSKVFITISAEEVKINDAKVSLKATQSVPDRDRAVELSTAMPPTIAPPVKNVSESALPASQPSASQSFGVPEAQTALATPGMETNLSKNKLMVIASIRKEVANLETTDANHQHIMNTIISSYEELLKKKAFNDLKQKFAVLQDPELSKTGLFAQLAIINNEVITIMKTNKNMPFQGTELEKGMTALNQQIQSAELNSSLVNDRITKILENLIREPVEVVVAKLIRSNILSEQIVSYFASNQEQDKTKKEARKKVEVEYVKGILASTDQKSLDRVRPLLMSFLNDKISGANTLLEQNEYGELLILVQQLKGQKPDSGLTLTPEQMAEFKVMMPAVSPEKSPQYNELLSLLKFLREGELLTVSPDIFQRISNVLPYLSLAEQWDPFVRKVRKEILNKARDSSEKDNSVASNNTVGSKG